MNAEIMPDGNRLLLLPEVAAFLRVSVKTVRRLIEDGKLKRFKARGAIRVWLSDLMDYLQA